MGFFWLSSVLISTVALYFWVPQVSALSIPDSSHYVEFVAKGTPHFLRIIGKAENNCTGIVSDNKGKIQCRLDAIKTGIALRDKHLLKYLDAKAHPMVSLTFEAKGDSFQGILELKGERVPVLGKYASNPLKLDFTIDTNDFGIEAPKYLGVGIEPDIVISAGLR